MATPTELGFKESRVKPLLYFRYYGGNTIIYIDMNVNPCNIYGYHDNVKIEGNAVLLRSVGRQLNETPEEARRRNAQRRLVSTLNLYERRWRAFFRLPKEEQRAIKLRERQLFDNFKNCNRGESDEMF